jgi:hypothetical protein
MPHVARTHDDIVELAEAYAAFVLWRSKSLSRSFAKTSARYGIDLDEIAQRLRRAQEKTGIEIIHNPWLCRQSNAA